MKNNSFEEIKNFYRNKKVFVTGHTGFKGSWLCLWLSQMGADVTACSLPPEDIRGNHFKLLKLDKYIKSYFIDIRNFDELVDKLIESSSEIVFHLAAQPLVRYSYDNPKETYETNVMGTINVFEAVLKSKTVHSIVNITTDKCYENKEWLWPYREIDELGGHDPYSASKACAEIVTSSYRRSFFDKHGIALASARAGNVIGGGDFAKDRIIPDIYEAIINNIPVILRNPDAVRPWQHVLDAIYGYLLLAMKLSGSDKNNFCEAFNFSPDQPFMVSVEEITKRFINQLGKGSYNIDRNTANVHEAKILRLDSSKAKEKLNWRANLDIKNTLDFTVEWFRNYANRPEEVYNNSIMQLEKYIKFNR